MQIIHTIKQLKEYVQKAKHNNQTIGLVPTMGYLHDGHLTLARTAKGENDVVIMSIFVNPTQFGPNEDFESYPRDLARDTALAESAGVDVVFAPTVEEMYPTDGGIKLHAGRQATILCGASRPGHFDGVIQVVTKLFHLAEPSLKRLCATLISRLKLKRYQSCVKRTA
jgi:pantoate--beta-alanine ligase